ncbi:proteasome assembly chaperone 2 [Spodoptera frugiperda]|uniref:Proteasome assembly chaperone 2 n=1 Tax=Spodoptera frugiperda TaxID=7108 RepID=A0A9R0ER80_SPOFR|nr:proteasome assembly chaperone 2 [Spodoptera frugiperda]
MAQVNHWKILTDCDFTGYTLVIPSVAVGNVGQLAGDLMISSLHMTKVGIIYSPALIPISGYDPYKIGSNSISSCCELYQCAERKVVILLLRAPLVYKYAKQFLTEVVDKFKGQNIKDVVILTSSFAHERKHIMTSPFRYVVNDLCLYTNKLRTLDWVEHETSGEPVKILGGGFASLLFEITKEKSVPCLLLYKFASEGDNIPDAYEMVQYLNTVIPLFNDSDLFSQLVPPVSWNLMYGGPPPKNIY